MPNLFKLFTKENITFALAVFGSVGTLISAIASFIHRHKKLSIHISKLYFDHTSIWLYCIFENKSQLPISINSLSVQIKNIFIHTSQIPQKVLEITDRSGNTITNRREFYSISFPIFLPALGGTAGYVYFDIPEERLEILPTELFFQAGTNRGMVRKRKLSYTLVDDWEDMY